MGGIVLSKLLIVRHHTLEVNGGIRGRLTNLDAQCTKYWFAEGSQIASGAQTIPAVSFSIVTRRSSVQLIKSVLSQIKIALEPFAEAASQDAYCRISALLLLASLRKSLTSLMFRSVATRCHLEASSTSATMETSRTVFCPRVGTKIGSPPLISVKARGLSLSLRAKNTPVSSVFQKTARYPTLSESVCLVNKLSRGAAAAKAAAQVARTPMVERKERMLHRSTK